MFASLSPNQVRCCSYFSSTIKTFTAHLWVLITKAFQCHQKLIEQTIAGFICQKWMLPAFGTWRVVILDLDGRKWMLHYTIMSLWKTARLLCACVSGIIMKNPSVCRLSAPYTGNHGRRWRAQRGGIHLQRRGSGAAATAVGNRSVFLSIPAPQSYGRHLVNPCCPDGVGPRLNTLTDRPRVLARTLPQAGAPTDHASDQPGHTEQNNR